MGLEASALFRGAFESAPDAVVIVDDAGAIVVANAQCRAVFGADPEELVGVPVESLVPGWRGEQAPRALVRLSAVRRDGNGFPAEISSAPVESDARAYVSVTVRDISARISEEERFRSLLEAAPDPTVILDATGVILLANDRTHAVFGHARDDLVGQQIDVLAPEHARERTMQGFRRYAAAPSEVPMGAVQRLVTQHRDGREIPVELSMAPLWTADGLLVSVALRDISDRLRMQEDSQRLRDDVIATVSHELRTPLTSIIGYAELMSDLDDDDLSRRARKLLGVIERNAVRELQLVDDLLTMAFLDDHRLRMAREHVDLEEVCRRVVEDQTLRARERGLELRFVGGETAPVVGDFHRLVQVVENLVTNAVKFTRPGGSVDVGLADHGAMGVLEVRDTGIGVSSEEKVRLFERLYRAPAAIAAQVQGAGLGLPIVRAIVEAHGGWVDLQSELGVGTVVRVALPHHERSTGA